MLIATYQPQPRERPSAKPILMVVEDLSLYPKLLVERARNDESLGPFKAGTLVLTCVAPKDALHVYIRTVPAIVDMIPRSFLEPKLLPDFPFVLLGGYYC
jgi:hypothetical protein